jgi:hypothetical protein
MSSAHKSDAPGARVAELTQAQIPRAHPLPGLVPGQVSRRTPSVTIETAVSEQVARRFYALYVKTFGDLATKAVARQLLHEHEFMEEMLDTRIDKYLARDETGEPVAMCTLTRHLETVPWISPDYFAHHYPEHAARDAVYYLGFVLVDQDHRGAHLSLELIRRLSETLIEERAMCAYDICSHNNTVLGLADAIESLITGMADVDVAVIDTQTYYRAIAMGPLNVPEMRSMPFS